MNFRQLKIVSGAVDARKWSAKWRNWNISDMFFCLSSIEGRKQRWPETFAPCMGTMPSERASKKMVFTFKEDRFDISDTPCTGRSSEFHEIRLNTLIHNDPHQCTRELANVMTFAFNGQGSKIGRMGTAYSNPKPQTSAGGASLLGRRRLARDQHRSFLSCIIIGDDKGCLYVNIRKGKEWSNPNKNQLHVQRPASIHKR